MNSQIDRFLIPVVGAITLTPWISSGEALILGVFIALTFGNPYAVQIKNFTHRLLALSVVGLGAGMNLEVVGRVGLHGIGYTVVGIGLTFMFGLLLGKVLKTSKHTSILITVGTAICGGSAIAAVAPVVHAKHQDVSVALGTVFLLNAAALFIFPWVGHHLLLSEAQFGLWSALAIHDTSSVVGATLQYGAHAVEIGTTVKLARALWIVPVALGIGFIKSNASADVPTNSQQSMPLDKPKAKKPWFILGFLIMAALMTWIPILQPAGHVIESVAKKLMVLTLFLIGSSLTKQTVKSVGLNPFVQGLILWLVMGSLSLGAVYFGIIGLN